MSSFPEADPMRPTTGKSLVSIPLERLRAGITLSAPVYTVRGESRILLVNKGTAIDRPLLNQLKGRGAQTVLVSAGDLAQMEMLDSHADGPSAQAVESRAKSAPGASQNRGAFDQATVTEFVHNYNDSLLQLENLFVDLSRGFNLDTKTVNAVAFEAARQLASDIDLFVSLGLRKQRDKYPFRHSLQVSMLAMSIGVALGLDERELIELGAGALIHDAGMLHINRSLWESPRQLNRIEFQEIQKHPGIIFDQIKENRNVTAGVRMVTYQMHERCDGSGYPRQRVRQQIHPLAKIAAVADVFVALVSPRPHRAALLPYDAMEQVIRDAHFGLLDARVVRALLSTVSLFPIGSFVMLSDIRVARILRANGNSYSQPVLAAMHHERLAEPAEIVDLLVRDDLQVERPLTAFEINVLGLDGIGIQTES